MESAENGGGKAKYRNRTKKGSRTIRKRNERDDANMSNEEKEPKGESRTGKPKKMGKR